MSDDRIPAPLEALVRAVAGRADDDDQRATTFARGLALGALVGAAIAGSTIWSRRRAIHGDGGRTTVSPERPEPTTGEDPSGGEAAPAPSAS